MATNSSAIQKKIETLKKGLNNKFITASQKEKIKAQVEKLESQSKALAPKKSTKTATSSSLTRLQKLVKNKKYSVYKGTGVDLKKDSDRPAKAIGKRTSKSGKTYYEYRANRIDVKQPPKEYPKLEDGGYMADGGVTIYKELDLNRRDGKVKKTQVITVENYREALERIKELESKNKNPNIKYYTGDIYREKGGYMAKGGTTKVANTYIPNKDVKELMVVLKGESKKLKGSDILDGVYAKNTALGLNSNIGKTKLLVDDAYEMIVKKAKDIDNDVSSVKKSDIKKLMDASFDYKDLEVFYFGVSALDPNVDIAYGSGNFGLDEEGMKDAIESYISAVNNKSFEIGLKYPELDWNKIIKKYKISKSGKEIDGEIKDYGREKTYYVSTIFEGEKVVIGTTTDRVRYINGKKEPKDDYYQVDPNDLANFRGGYWGLVTSSKTIMYDIANTLLSQKGGYVKDMELFVN